MDDDNRLLTNPEIIIERNYNRHQTCDKCTEIISKKQFINIIILFTIIISIAITIILVLV